LGPITHLERERPAAGGENPETPFNNLVRLGLIQVAYDIDGKKVKVRVPISRFTRWDSRIEADFDGQLSDWYLLTDVAEAFVEACRAPKTIDAA